MEAALTPIFIFLSFIGPAFFGVKGIAILLAWKEVEQQKTDDAKIFLNEVLVWAAIYLFVFAFLSYPYIQ